MPEPSTSGGAPYRGRLAPSPTGYLHLGHARTFWIAHRRTRAAGGKLVFRNEDLDQQRSRPEFVNAMYEDLRWLGIDWDEGPDIGGPFAPYSQSRRRDSYVEVWRGLRDRGFIYPCSCSRKDLEHALEAPHEEAPGDERKKITQRATRDNNNDELPYPGTCRPRVSEAGNWSSPAGTSWRFRVPDGEAISFNDLYFGPQEFVAGQDFSDFLIWRRDDVPAYQLAVVADDSAMQISEVVRGADLLKSTARQLLLIRALNLETPRHFHCPLVLDENDVRLAKRHDALSLRTLRADNADPATLLKTFNSIVLWDQGL